MNHAKLGLKAIVMAKVKMAGSYKAQGKTQVKQGIKQIHIYRVSRQAMADPEARQEASHEAERQEAGTGGEERVDLRQDADGHHKTAEHIHGCTVQQVHRRDKLRALERGIRKAPGKD